MEQTSNPARESDLRRVDTYNRLHGHLRGAPCGVCMDKGWIMKMNEDGYIVMVECLCRAARVRKKGAAD